MTPGGRRVIVSPPTGIYPGGDFRTVDASATLPSRGIGSAPNKRTAAPGGSSPRDMGPTGSGPEKSGISTRG